MSRFDEPDITAEQIAEAMERSGQPRPQGNRVLPTLYGRGAPSQAVPDAQLVSGVWLNLPYRLRQQQAQN